MTRNVARQWNRNLLLPKPNDARPPQTLPNKNIFFCIECSISAGMYSFSDQVVSVQFFTTMSPQENQHMLHPSWHHLMDTRFFPVVYILWSCKSTKHPANHLGKGLSLISGFAPQPKGGHMSPTFGSGHWAHCARDTDKVDTEKPI